VRNTVPAVQERSSFSEARAGERGGRMFSDSVCIRNSRSTHKLEPKFYPLAF
jgi:hypothetical protein